MCVCGFLFAGLFVLVVVWVFLFCFMFWGGGDGDCSFLYSPHLAVS